MRRVKLLGLALMGVFAFGVVIAATAAAEEKEPAGLLFLPKEEGPEGGVPSRLMKTEAGDSRQKGTPWKMIAAPRRGRTRGSRHAP